MASFNKIILAGNLTRDPQLSYLPSQTAVCEFGLAVNRKWKDGQGNQKEEVLFIDCKLFGKGAETFNQYMSKGAPVLVEGRLRLESWDGADGQKRSKHTINVETFQFLGGKDKPDQPPAMPKSTRTPQPPPADMPSGNDLPF